MQLTLSHSIGYRETPIVKEADQRRSTLEAISTCWLRSFGDSLALFWTTQNERNAYPLMLVQARTLLDPLCRGKYLFQYL